MAKKRYQAFISSTYEDLREERKNVIQAILENDCFPSGMELFAASNKRQWDIIKSEIDESDFYIVIIAGRYGSIGTDEQGNKVSFTEMEFDYALKKDKPIIALIYENIDNLPKSKCEQNKNKSNKLKAFRSKAMNGRMIRYWSNKDNLKSEVSYAINKLVHDENNNMTGWVPAKDIQDKNLPDIEEDKYANDPEQQVNFQEKELLERFSMEHLLDSSDVIPVGFDRHGNSVTIDLIRNYVVLAYGPRFCGKSNFLRMIYSVTKARDDMNYVIAMDYQQSWFTQDNNAKIVSISEPDAVLSMINELWEIAHNRIYNKKEGMRKRLNKNSLFETAKQYKRINLFITNVGALLGLPGEDEKFIKIRTFLELALERLCFYNMFFWIEFHDRDRKYFYDFVETYCGKQLPDRIQLGGRPNDYYEYTDYLIPYRISSMTIKQGKGLLLKENYSIITVPYIED